MALMLVLWPVGMALGSQAQSLKGMLLSPGSLSASHADLVDKCDACHAGFARAEQANLCLDCHKPIARDIKAKLRLHGHLQVTTCTACHAEHQGEQADITGLDADRFDHGLTAFPLRGAHQDLACDQCHNADHTARTGGRFAITAHACTDCHEDLHEGALGSDCAGCHDETRWQQTRFNHKDTRFPLVGKHAQVMCVACHGDKTFKAPAACNDCHAAADVHRGDMGADCGQCHDAVDWRHTSFDHDRTHFPLGEAHGHLACTLCHSTNNPAFESASGRPPPCADCHAEDDVHGGSYGKSCNRCHTGSAFRQATFDHDKTSFRLVGRHEKLPCIACHAPGKPVSTAPARSACIDCHRGDDVHAGELGEACANCHSTRNAWKDSGFDHDFTAFPLNGMHKLLDCKACHATLTFKTSLRTCDQCHEAGQSHPGVFVDHCEVCHNTRDWRLWQFDHGTTHFPLRGGHAQVACVKCHTPERQASLSADTTCFACHASDDRHNQQFGRRCDNCHNESSWKAVSGRNLH